MTEAKLVTSPAQGHGLTSRITDTHFAAAAAGKPVPHIVGLCILKQVGFGESDTASGKHRTVKYEAIKLEPLLDAEQAANARLMIQAAYEARTSSGDQGVLPLSFPGQMDEENRKALMERIETWAEANDITGAELEERWRSYWSIGAGEEYSFGDRGVPAEYRKSPAAWLGEFAFECGAIKESHDDEEDDIDGGDPTPDDASDGDGDGPDDDKPGLAAVPDPEDDAT